MANLLNTTIGGTASIQLPSGTTAQRPASPQAGMVRYNTTIADTEYYDGTGWYRLSDSNIEASGGIITDIDIGGTPYRIHQFRTTGNSTFTVTKGGLAEVVIVGGGGSGGFGHGGGGGGGAVVIGNAVEISPGSYTITVGAGAAGNTANNQRNSGGSSSAFGVTATGGGSGGNEDASSPATQAGAPGANGGGGNYGSAAGGIGTAPSVPAGWTAYAGNNGGAGQPGSSTPYGCGGGGGAGSAGSTANATRGEGHGGPGVATNILGYPCHFGGGGGGVIYTGNGIAGNGGIGGGGGASCVTPGQAGRGDHNSIFPSQPGRANSNSSGSTGGAGAPNSGGGGGAGANENDNGGAGGSGIVIIRYRRNSNPISAPTYIAKGPIGSSEDNPAPNAMAIMRANPGCASGSYWIDWGGPKLIHCEMNLEGGGWMMILNYVKGQGLNSNVYTRTDSFPQLASEYSLYNDETESTGTRGTWGHISNALANQYPWHEYMFYGRTSFHSRVIHWTGHDRSIISYIKTGSGAMVPYYADTNTNRNGVLYNSASMPFFINSDRSGYSNQGNLAMTSFPIYGNSTIGNPRSHWGIDGGGNRWEVDDYAGNQGAPTNYDPSTIHRIWVR